MTLFTTSMNSSKFDKKCLFLFNLYNLFAKKYGFPKALKLTMERKRVMSAIENYRMHDLFWFMQEFNKALPFFIEADWFSFDWIIKEDNFVKVMEGRYAKNFKVTVRSSVEYKTRDF